MLAQMRELIRISRRNVQAQLGGDRQCNQAVAVFHGTCLVQIHVTARFPVIHLSRRIKPIHGQQQAIVEKDEPVSVIQQARIV